MVEATQSFVCRSQVSVDPQQVNVSSDGLVPEFPDRISG